MKLGIIRNGRVLAVALFLIVGAGYVSAYPQQSSPDNTRQNQNPGATADSQQNATSDMDITRQIRRSIMDDKSLSMDAHNVKIITRNGGVTLKGPVDSENEKAAVEAKAVDVVGKANVVNRLRVRASQPANQ